MSTTIDPEIVLIERELAKRSYMDYVRYVFKYIHKKAFYENWHHHYLAAVLEDYYEGKIPLLLISLPPSYSKTEFCVKDGVSYKCGKSPHFSNMYVSYGDDLSTKTSTETKEIMEHPAYKALFPTVQFKKSKDTHWSLRGGGGMFATTPTSATTGFHTNNIIIDDPVKTIEGHVKSVLKKVIDFWDGTIQSRLEDWGDNTGSIMVIMQRQDVDDLVGHILRTRKDAVYICLEALNDVPRVYEWGDFRYEREALEPLFPAKHSLQKLLMMKETAPATFATQYQQDPEQSDAGYFIKDFDIHFIPFLDIPEQNLYILVDNAESLNVKSDNRAVSCMGYSVDYTTQAELFVLHDLSFGVFDEEATMDEIIRFMVKFRADVWIENKAGGITLARLLQKRILTVNADLRSKGKPIITQEVKTYAPKRSISKNQKIMSAKTYTQTGAFRISNECDKKGVEQFIKEALAFNPDKTSNKDDCLDVTFGAVTAEFVEGKVSHKPKKEKSKLARKKGERRGWRV